MDTTQSIKSRLRWNSHSDRNDSTYQQFGEFNGYITSRYWRHLLVKCPIITPLEKKAVPKVIALTFGTAL